MHTHNNSSFDYERWLWFEWAYPRRGGGGGGGGGVLRYFHTYVGSGRFRRFKICNFNIFRVFRKKGIFLGYEDFVNIFFGPSQKWTIFRGYFYAFLGLFLRSKYRMGDIFMGVAKISNIFGGCMNFLIFSGVNGRCWARAYV